MNFKLLVKSFFIKTNILKFLGVDMNKYKSRYLYFKYKDYFKNYSPKNDNTKTIKSNIVWTMWYQGIENMPPIVKACINSMEKCFAASDFKIKIITKDNINEYIKFPSHIETKFIQKKITITHYSDIVRTYLLVHYGGFWIDSCVFLGCNHNHELFKMIKNLDFFAFKTLDPSNKYYDCQKISSQFLYSKSQLKIMVDQLNLLYKYWEINNKLEHYSIFHILFSIAIDMNKEIWDTTPSFNSLSNHALQMDWIKPFNKKRFEEIINHISPIQKLYRPSKIIKGSFQEFIIKSYSN